MVSVVVLSVYSWAKHIILKRVLKDNFAYLLIYDNYFNLKGGHTHVYPFNEEDPNGPTRTDESYNDDVKKRYTQNGVMGYCCLSYLAHFHPISGTCIDYMHTVLEGVVKSLFHKWFSQENHSKDYSLRKDMNLIDIRILSIRPPKFVPTTPRSIFSWKTWRAHEYLSFLVYYSIPLFHDIMETIQFEHLIKLVIFMEILLSREIKLCDLDFGQKIIEAFVSDFSKIYTINSMLSGVHELLHLVDCTKNFGPLNYINCFPFEELNRKVIGTIHGRDLMGEEFIKLFSLMQSLTSTVSNLNSDSKLVDYIKQEMFFKTSNRKRVLQQNNKVKVLGKKEIIKDLQIIELIEKKFGLKLEQIEVYNKISFKEVIYSSSKLQSKNFDSCFMLKDGKTGIIECFFQLNNKFWVVAKQIIRYNNPFYWSDCSEIRASTNFCYISSNLFIDEVTNINKLALTIIENKYFISNFTISHLFS